MPNPNEAPANVERLRAEHAHLAQQMRKARDDWDVAINEYRTMDMQWRNARSQMGAPVFDWEAPPDYLKPVARRANALMDNWLAIKAQENRAYLALRNAVNPGAPPSPRREQPMVYV